MPQLALLMIAGAGVVAYKWMSRAMARQAEAARAATEETMRQAASDGPKDLGALEWDDTAGVYRPARH